MTEEKAIELLARMAEIIGFKLEEMPRDAREDRRWCFSIGTARYTNWFFSAKKMLRLVLLNRYFSRVPGSGWNIESGAKDSYRNPFFKLSLDELELKLDVLCPRKPKEM